MKLNSNFITHISNGEHYMVSVGDTSFNGIVKNNDTANFIIDCLKVETTQQEIVDKILKTYSGVEEQVAQKDVMDIIEKLRSIGAIVE